MVKHFTGLHHFFLAATILTASRRMKYDDFKSVNSYFCFLFNFLKFIFSVLAKFEKVKFKVL